MLRKAGRGRQVRRVLRPRRVAHDAGRPRHDRQHGARIRRDDGLLPGRRRDAATTCGCTGRTDAEVDLVERYYKEQGLFRTDDAPDARIHQDAARSIWARSSRAWPGPKRPQDRVPLTDMKESFRKSLRAPIAERGFALDEAGRRAHGHGRRSTATRADDRPRRRGDRRHHQLHQHQQSLGDARPPACWPRRRSKRGCTSSRT